MLAFAPAIALLQCKKSQFVFLTFPDSPFQLHQPFEPAGDQPQAIDALSQGLVDASHSRRCWA